MPDKWYEAIAKAQQAEEDAQFGEAEEIPDTPVITDMNLILDDARMEYTVGEELDISGIFIEITDENGEVKIYDAEELLNNEEIKKNNKSIVIGFADTDNLKKINDGLGHDVGDIAIMATSDAIRKVIPDNSVMGRIGGDEFALIFATDTKKEADVLKEKLDEAIEQFNSNLSKKFTLSISLGVDIYAISECVDIKTLLDSADKKMYHIKKKNHMNQ